MAGYAQPRLRRRLSPLGTSAVLGAVWGSWHLPLFFLEGTWHESVGLASPEGLLILLGAIPLSAAAWFVSERLRGGVPAAVLVHAAGNAAMALFPPETFTAGLVYIGSLFVLGAAVLIAGRGALDSSSLPTHESS
ncbi:CPBP family glutamic-type intramembrane protease [Oerskovia sp. M15]